MASFSIIFLAIEKFSLRKGTDPLLEQSRHLFIFLPVWHSNFEFGLYLFFCIQPFKKGSQK